MLFRIFVDYLMSYRHALFYVQYEICQLKPSDCFSIDLQNLRMLDSVVSCAASI